jgi:hypothetical protein
MILSENRFPLFGIMLTNVAAVAAEVKPSSRAIYFVIAGLDPAIHAARPLV